MSDIPPHNPYSTPNYQQPLQDSYQAKGSNAKIVAPGIVLIVLGSLSFILSAIGFIVAMGEPPKIDPELPPVFHSIVELSYGTSGMIQQGIFLIISLIIMLGGAMMVKIKAWPLCLIAAILSIININSCICIAGLPVGIWAIVILSLEDVRRSFDSNR